MFTNTKRSLARSTMHNMIGKPVFTFTFRRNDKAITLGEMFAVRIASDPLFQRFLVVAKTGELSLEKVRIYELCPLGPVLFDSINVFRNADEPQLAHAINEHARDGILDFVPETEKHVLDGGSLLHRILWRKAESYGAIAQSYICRLHRQAIR